MIANHASRALRGAKDGCLKLLQKIAGSRLLSLAVLIAAGLLAYAPVLNGQFLWDDTWLVGQNPFFKSPVFSFEVFRHYLYLEGTSTYYRPVQNLSYMVDYWLWNSNTFGYHLANVLFHALSGYLLFRLVEKLLPTLAGSEAEKHGCQPVVDFCVQQRAAVAFIVALVWVIHPIHNAAVAYVSGRADSLASLFAVSAWLTFLNARRTASRAVRLLCLAASPVLCLLALGSKEIAIVWILLFVFHTLAFDKSSGFRTKLWTLVGLGMVIGFYCWLRHLPAAVHGVAPAAPAPAFAMRLILFLRALGDYTSLIFFPGSLHMDRTVYQTGPYYTLAAWQNGIWFEYLSVIGAAALAVFGLLCWKKLPGRRLRIFAAGWFVIGFLPISNLFPLNAQVAEHWIYMPSFGFMLFVAGCLPALPARVRTAAAALCIVALPALMWRTASRAYEWADDERFYSQTVRAGGGSARVNLNLALVYSRKGDLAKAEKMMRQTLAIDPDYIAAKLNLGMNLLRQGRDREAEQFLKFDKAATEQMARTQPHTWSAALNMACMHYNAKDNAAALAILDEAIPRYPGNWELVELKARILGETAGAPAAIPVVEEYARGFWWHYPSAMMLGRLRAVAGESDAAVAALRRAGSLDVHAAEPFAEIARVRFGEKKFAEACEAQQKAVRRDPDQLAQYLFLASLLDQLGRKEEAGEALARAEELRRSVQADARHL
jgi:protein O-mannosyl-transferase